MLNDSIEGVGCALEYLKRNTVTPSVPGSVLQSAPVVIAGETEAENQ
jgi:hypothetical protein